VGRQHEARGRSGAGLARDLDAAAKGVCELGRHREPEAGPAAVLREERQEDPVEQIGRDAVAAVAH